MSKKWNAFPRIAVEQPQANELIEIVRASPVRITFVSAANAAIKAGLPYLRTQMAPSLNIKEQCKAKTKS